MPATIAAVSAPAAPAAASSTNTAPAQASGDAKSAAPASGDAPKTPTAAKPGESAAEKAQRLKFKAKIDGREEEVEWGEEEAARSHQKLKHFEKTRGESDRQRQQFEEQLAALTADPVGFLRTRNVDLVALGKQEAARQAELDAMDPVQRDLAEARAELDRFKSDAQKRAEADKTAAEQREHVEMVQGNARLFGQAIAASGLVPPLPPNATQADKVRFAAERGYLMKLYGEVRELALHAGEPDLSPEQLAAGGERLETMRFSKNIKSRLANPAWRAKNAAVAKELAGALVGQLQGPELVEMLGRQAVDRITRESLTALRKSPIPVVAEAPPANGAAPVQQRRADAPQSMFSVLDQLSGS